MDRKDMGDSLVIVMELFSHPGVFPDFPHIERGEHLNLISRASQLLSLQRLHLKCLYKLLMYVIFIA